MIEKGWLLPPFCFFNVNCQNSACFRTYPSSSRQNERFCKLFSYQVSSSFISCACIRSGLEPAQVMHVLNKGVACEPPVPCRAVCVTSCEYGVGDGFFPGCLWCSAWSVHSCPPVDVRCGTGRWWVGSHSVCGDYIRSAAWSGLFIWGQNWLLFFSRYGIGISRKLDAAKGTGCAGA